MRFIRLEVCFFLCDSIEDEDELILMVKFHPLTQYPERALLLSALDFVVLLFRQESVLV